MINLFLAKRFSFYKMLINGLEWCGLLYLWIIVMFLINCLEFHSDGTHSLQRIHWWASDVMLNFSKSDEKQTHLHLGWPKGEYIFIDSIPLTRNTHHYSPKKIWKSSLLLISLLQTAIHFVCYVIFGGNYTAVHKFGFGNFFFLCFWK